MPLLSTEQQEAMFAQTPVICEDCDAVLRKNYCRQCDEFFRQGHAADCRQLSGPCNDSHWQHRIYALPEVDAEDLRVRALDNGIIPKPLSDDDWQLLAGRLDGGD